MSNRNANPAMLAATALANSEEAARLRRIVLTTAKMSPEQAVRNVVADRRAHRYCVKMVGRFRQDLEELSSLAAHAAELLSTAEKKAGEATAATA